MQSLFRRGDVPRDMRLLAAAGGLMSDPVEELELLLWLVDDEDPAVAGRAARTLDGMPAEVLAGVMARPGVTDALREALAGRGVAPGVTPAPGDAVVVAGERSAPDLSASRPGALAGMPVIDRLKIALRGSRAQRAVLVRDPNKVVAVAVLGSPKLDPTEIETYARMTSVQEEVLRIIGTTRHWIKHYPVIAALAANPKTPLAIAMPLVSRLKERDLEALARDRNVSDGVRAMARKFLQAGNARRA